jgi:MYXO-CTERM domain-containing protein
VEITSPAAGATFDSDPGSGLAEVMIEVSAEDSGIGVADVEVLVNGTVAGSDPTSPFELVASLPPGVHEIGATATDLAGNSASAQTVTIGVDEDPPDPGPGDSGDDGSDDGGDGEGTSDGSNDGGDDDGGHGSPWPNGVDEPHDQEGCGCSSAPAPSTALGLALCSLFALRRRQPSRK